MFFRIGRDRYFDIGNALDTGNQIGAIVIAARMRRVALADAANRVAATQVRCAAGARLVSLTMRLTVECVRSRVEPPAP